MEPNTTHQLRDVLRPEVSFNGYAVAAMMSIRQNRGSVKLTMPNKGCRKSCALYGALKQMEAQGYITLSANRYSGEPGALNITFTASITTQGKTLQLRRR